MKVERRADLRLEGLVFSLDFIDLLFICGDK